RCLERRDQLFGGQVGLLVRLGWGRRFRSLLHRHRCRGLLLLLGRDRRLVTHTVRLLPPRGDASPRACSDLPPARDANPAGRTRGYVRCENGVNAMSERQCPAGVAWAQLGPQPTSARRAPSTSSAGSIRWATTARTW